MMKSSKRSPADLYGAGLAAVLPSNSPSWTTQPHLVKLNLYLLIILGSSFTLGFDGSMMNGLLSLSTWNDYFGTPRSSLLGLINAVLPLGVILGSLPAGVISDRWGRRVSIMVGDVLLIAGAVMQGCSHNVGTFIASRFFVGLGIEFASMPSPILITELAYPTHRGKATALYNCFFYVGAIASSWTTFGTYQMGNTTWSWRIPSLLQILVPLIQLVMICFVPESPRWLIAKGEVQKARAIFTKFHAGGDADSPLVAFQMDEITESVQKELEVQGMAWSSLWATKADKKRLAIVLSVPLISQWAGNGIISYYFSLVLDSVGITASFDQTLINGILQIFNTFAAVLGSLLVDRMGRRPLWLWSCTGMLLCYIAWTACSAVNHETRNSTSGVFVIVFIFIYFFHYDIAVTPFTWSYPAELLPFHVRGKGMSLVNLGNGLALMFNSFVNPIAMEAIGWKYFIVYCVILVVILAGVFLFFPETKGHTLEEMAEIFEGDQMVWQMKKSVDLEGPAAAAGEETEKEVSVETIEDTQQKLS